MSSRVKVCGMGRVLIAALVVMLSGTLSLAQAPTPAHDSNQPIEITADTLEVLQNEQQAIFTGNVMARQGDINMKSERMTVFYKGGGDNKGDSATGAMAAHGISRIIAEGEVLFTSPEETAQSAKANYDVDGETITMTQNVVLTRGQNVLKGNELVYNLTTGKSILNAPGRSQEGGGRVKGLFIPEQNQ